MASPLRGSSAHHPRQSGRCEEDSDENSQGGARLGTRALPSGRNGTEDCAGQGQGGLGPRRRRGCRVELRNLHSHRRGVTPGTQERGSWASAFLPRLPPLVASVAISSSWGAPLLHPQCWGLTPTPGPEPTNWIVATASEVGISRVKFKRIGLGILNGRGALLGGAAEGEGASGTVFGLRPRGLLAALCMASRPQGVHVRADIVQKLGFWAETLPLIKVGPLANSSSLSLCRDHHSSEINCFSTNSNMTAVDTVSKQQGSQKKIPILNTFLLTRSQVSLKRA